jgi:hypothetical protein
MDVRILIRIILAYSAKKKNTNMIAECSLTNPTGIHTLLDPSDYI